MEEGTTSGADVPLVRVTGGRRLMGVAWTVTVNATTAAAGEGGIAAALDEVARLEAILSDYRPDSELSRLSAASPTDRAVPVSDDLWAVLGRAVVYRDESDGAFDPTVGPLTTLWRQSRRSGVLPLPAKLSTARGAVGPLTLVLEDRPRGVRLTRPGMRLDLGGIGMGYAIDRALAILAARGIGSALVDASGDVGASGAPPGEAGWRIAIDPIPGTPEAATGQILLADAAVTTSGDARQSVAIGGRRYSHIVDPRTGIGIDGPAAVTVIAPDATAADALATAANVLGPVRGRTLLENQAGCAGRFVSVGGEGEGSVREVQTSRWPSTEPSPTGRQR
jgi:thiamine biosynthesis lipoprotein